MKKTACQGRINPTNGTVQYARDDAKPTTRPPTESAMPPRKLIVRSLKAQTSLAWDRLRASPFQLQF